ncbi:Hypothetical predicted protein [Paramuricea clavata]|uniref:Little elongation complex subunit 1 C-terminal domain-containing protein n=1 Tax=Paramuricea clavata TaxID=317549 RepID=A0A7D9DWP6_PARCT|nr:Hypothetical predicted protein [Paramuricea clavata]
MCKYAAELISKLDGAQRSADVIKLQLKKSLELVEPLQKKCNELEREKVLQCGEIQALQDRLRGSENLVGQLQSVIKENEVSANSLRINASFHTGELEDYKKSQKKKEAQISKLSEQVLTEKKANKALNKKLTKSQNQVKTLLDETEESKKLIATLQQEQNTGQNDDCEQQRNTSLEKQIMTLKTEAQNYKGIIRELKEEVCKAKQQNTDGKFPAENKIKSPTTPRRSPRKRKSVTPKQEKETSAILEQKRPLTRLQQKNLIEEIEKKSSQLKSSESSSPSRQESLTSESENDADEMGTLLDKINEMLDMPCCPSLSPLPPSPFLDGSSVGAFGNNDPDYTCDDGGNDDNAIDDGNQNYIGNTDYPVNIHDKSNGNDNINKDNLDDVDNLNKDDHYNILQNENLEESRGKKRELGESTTPECCDTFMTLRSRKRLKNANSDSDSGPFSKDENEVRPHTLKRTKSVEQELNTPVVNCSVTRSKSVEKTTEGVLEKPMSRQASSPQIVPLQKMLKIQANSPQIFPSAENNVVDTSKHSEGSSEGESKEQSDDTLQKIPRRPRTRSMDKLVKQDVVDEEVSSKDETSSGAKFPTMKNQTNSETLFQDSDSIMESPKALQTSSLDELVDPDVIFEEAVSEKPTEAKVPATEDQSNNETLTSTETLIRPQTRSTHALYGQVVATEGTNGKEEENSNDFPPTKNGTNMETVAHEALDNKCSEKRVPVFEKNLSAAETNHRETDEVLKCLRDIIDIVANESSRKISMIDASKELNDTESCTDSQDGQKEVMDCLDVVNDSVVKLDNNSSAPLAEIDCVKPRRRHNVVKDENKKSSTSKCETNDTNDNHVKSGECDVRNINIGSENVANTENSDPKATDKTKLDDLNSSESVEPMDRTSIGKTRKRPMAVHENVKESCNNIDDHNKKNKTAKTEALDSVDHMNKYGTTVSAEIKQSIKNLKSSGNENVAHTRKHKTGTISDCVSTSNEREVTRTDENDLSRSSFDGSEFLKLTSHDLVTKNTHETQYETSNEAVSASESKVNIASEKSTTNFSSEYPTICHGITSTTSPPRDSFDSLEQTTPLSPIPDTPKRRGRSEEIPCFDLLDHLPLSPIPPSPPPRADEECISTNLTFDENIVQNPKEAHVVEKQQKLNRNELPHDSLRRYPGVNEPQFAVSILTRFKDKEITLEDLITAFSVQKNVKNHTPICNGIVTVLKLTHDDEEHALLEKCAEHYERWCEGTGDPIVPEFELQVLIAVKRLCNIQRHSSLLKKLVKWLGMNLCELFNSGKNDAGLLAMCRLYTGVSRLMGEGSYIRVLCYDILKQNKRHLVAERMILAMALVWPEVLGKGIHALTIHPEAVTISGPPYSPFLATLQVMLMSREMSCEQTRQWLQRLCGWCDIPRDNNVFEWLARDLVRVLRVTNDATSDESPACSSTIKNVAFESIKSLELLAIIMGWKWTNDILIRGILWPVFKEWKIQIFDAKQETILDSESQKAERVLNTKEIPNSSEAGTINTDGLECPALNAMFVDCQSNITDQVELECVNNEQLVETSNETVCPVNMKTESNIDTQMKSDFKHDENMDTTIANILHFLGVLGCERLQKGEMINLDAVINLMCAIVASPACEKVSFNVQLAAASALLDMVTADTVKITPVLEHWSNRGSKGTLTAKFARRMKEVRAHTWSNIL